MGTTSRQTGNVKRMELKRLLRVTSLIAAIVALASAAACSGPEDEVLSIGRCYKAARYLEDADLMGAAEYRMKHALAHIDGSPREAMEINQRLLDEAEPQGSSTDPVYTLRVAQKWKDSGYCTKTQSEFQDFIAQQVAANSRSFGNPAEDAASCPAYRAQFGMTFLNRYARKSRDDLLPYLRQTIHDASAALSPEQSALADQALAGPGMTRFATGIFKNCEAAGSLRAAIAAAPELEAARSDATALTNAPSDTSQQ
jgi:hypothetical protein